jgi:glycosyltransferase involved in cell wall biosynthesis
MKVCYFGTYEGNYPRNRILINGLKLNGVEIEELHESVLERIQDKTKLSVVKKMSLFLSLFIAYLKLSFRRLALREIDYIIVGYIGQLDMVLARLLFPNKKILFNPMISLYDTLINDRGLTKNWLSKKICFYLDKISCLLANKIILDTPEHAYYFQKTFRISSEKLDYIYIGADESIFKPARQDQHYDEFNILFYGKFTPLHGLKYIVKAAKLLEKEKNIKFTIIGQGQMSQSIKALANDLNITNINFIDWVPFNKLPEYINKAQICLGGHFGEGDKAQRVVANKIFQIIASRKPVIIADTKTALNCGFINNHNAILIPPGDEQAIATVIKLLRNDVNLRDNIAHNGYRLFNEKFTTILLGKKCKEILSAM